MNSKKSMGEVLYDLLPQLYKVEDAKQKPIPYPLKRYLQVAGIGLDFMRSKIEGHANIFDPDKAPPELLPHLAKMLGFEFPYDMTEKEQRSLLKVLPILYKLKGTQTVFDYLARQIFGLDAKAYSEWISRGGQNGENLIEINVESSGELSNLQTRIDRYYKYSELFRPVNHKLFWRIILYYTDVYNKQKILEEYDIEQLFIDDDHIVPLGNEHLLNHLLLNQGGFPLLKGDVYDIKSKYMEELIETLKYIEDDFSVKIREDELFLDYISGIIDLDSYSISKALDNYTFETVFIDDDVAEYLTNNNYLLNHLILNSGKTVPIIGDSYKLMQKYAEELIEVISYIEGDVSTSLREDELVFEAISGIIDSDVYNENLIIGESYEELVIINDNLVEFEQDEKLNTFALNESRIYNFKWESYNSAKITESFSQDLLMMGEDDVYNNSGKDDSYFSETATINDTEIYLATKDDNYRYDVLTDLTNCLNMGMLNSTILLSKKPAITVYQ